VTTPEDAVHAANERFGVHPGYRALHAKGTLFKGTFTPTPAAARLSRAAHLQDGPVPLTARVSNGSGDPDEPDYAPDVRGLAIKIYLPDGSRTDIVAQSAPRFPVPDPAGFVDLLRAAKPGPAMAWKLPVFLARNPRAARDLPLNLVALRPPVSYATCRYYAIHAFKWVDVAGGATYVRYTLVPEAGEAHLTPLQARKRGRDYLRDEMLERVTHEPVRFRLELQVGDPNDDVDDPRSVWPDSRERLDGGTVEIAEPDLERERGDDILVFDPTRVVEGIELTDDPVLRFRTHAYAASVLARTGVHRPDKLA
jgi:catalase